MSRLPLTVPRYFLLLPWLILVAMLGVTWLAWNHEHQTVHKEFRSQFDFALRDSVSRIEQRVASYEQMLRGVQGLVVTTGLTNRDVMRHYVETLQLDANFSGIEGISVIEWVPSLQKSTHLADMRQRGFADYKIYPDPGAGEDYAPIIQREPQLGRHRSPLGFNPWADPVRRLAMERARDSGMVAITGKVRLASDKDSETVPGFVMYMPIFATGQPRASVAQRRAHLIGWVTAAFHMSDFMASLYGKLLPGLTLSIYDDIHPTDAALMYRVGDVPEKPMVAASKVISANEYMVVAGHTWMLTLGTQEEFEARFGRSAGFVIALTGMGLSLSMALLAWFMVTGRARALQLAAEMTEELRHVAQHDQLTGLPNRALFNDRIQHALTHAERYGGQFAVIFLDLDKFKPINDNFGHAIGDLLLQQVARRLQESVRASDTVGRIGGDEFVVLIPELAGSDAANAALGLAEKIRHAVHQPFKVDGHDLTISCSLGVAVYPDDGTDEVALTKSADKAMYRAKDAGRNMIKLAA
jgi:diguanylate cyclase (GGDEF)-like protein